METNVLIFRLELLAKQKGVSLTTAFTESKVGKNFKNNLKYAQPSLGKVTMLANYFGVSPQYLLGETDEKEITPTPARDERERQLLESFSRLDDKDKSAVLAVVESMNV